MLPNENVLVGERKNMEEMQRAADKVFFWQDEKLFPIETVVAYQNDMVYASFPETILEVVRRYFKWQNPTGVIGWFVIASGFLKSRLMFS